MTLSQRIAQKIKLLLMNQKEEIDSELANVKKADPYMQEYKDEGSRNLDEPTEEAVDTREHVIGEAIAADLENRKEDISDALEKIEKGDYGICEVCKKTISEERLSINPTAKRCIDCEKKELEKA